MTRVLGRLAAADFLLGTQSVDKALLYRRASFCIFFHVDGAAVVYNTLSGEMAELSAAEEKYLCGEHPFCEEMRELVEGYFLVGAEHDDILLCDGVRRFYAAAAEQINSYRNFTVFTTTDCNARCFYCYEAGQRRVSMRRETAERAAELIARLCRGEPCELTYYGGEPLLNTEAMDIISERLEAAGVSYSSKLATNGSLFTDELISRAKELWHTDKVQLTLDGTKEVYNRIKAYTDGREDAFSEVLSNVEALLAADIKVNIRLNVDEHNIADMHLLCNLLSDRFKGMAGLNVYSALLFDCEGAKRPVGKGENRLALAREMLLLEEQLCVGGVSHPRRLSRKPTLFYCKADSKNSLVITAEGKLVKCDYITDRGFCGDVENGVSEELVRCEREKYSVRVGTAEHCRGCSAYPVCLRPVACPTSMEPCDAARRLLCEERLLRSAKYAYLKERCERK